ncbi:MAG: glycine hydroxymethyltransferase [Chlamydiales bacterium]
MQSLVEKYINTTKKRNSAALAYLAALDHLNEVAPSVAKSILHELDDQRSHIKLIASENYSSLSVQLAMGNLLTDKYAEGYPFHRFYAGCENVDAIEHEAAQLAQTIFEADFAYVQPHSGADANLVAFLAILTERVQCKELEKLQKKSIDDLSAEEFEGVRQALVNQKVMGLSLASGGHLTHGYRHNISAKLMRAVTYDTDWKSGLIDYDVIAKRVREERPLILMAGYSAYPRAIDFAKMRSIADEVGAVLMVDMAHFAGLVAGKVFVGNENPVPFADILTTTTHKTLRGPRGGMVLSTNEFAESINKGCPHVLGGPLPHVMAAKAVALREANTPEFCLYASQIVKNAKTLAKAIMQRGLKVATDGTDNHLILVNLSDLNISGRQAELALREAGLTVNRNMVPFDLNGPWYTSGIRLGTPAVTTLGMGSAEMEEIADILVSVVKGIKPAIIEKRGEQSRAKYQIDEQLIERSRRRVLDMLHAHPLYPEVNIKLESI